MSTNRDQLGLLGRLFGDESHAPTNILGLIVTLLLVAGIVAVLCAR